MKLIKKLLLLLPFFCPTAQAILMSSVILHNPETGRYALLFGDVHLEVPDRIPSIVVASLLLKRCAGDMRPEDMNKEVCEKEKAAIEAQLKAVVQRQRNDFFAAIKGMGVNQVVLAAEDPPVVALQDVFLSGLVRAAKDIGVVKSFNIDTRKGTAFYRTVTTVEAAFKIRRDLLEEMENIYLNEMKTSVPKLQARIDVLSKKIAAAKQKLKRIEESILNDSGEKEACLKREQHISQVYCQNLGVTLKEGQFLQCPTITHRFGVMDSSFNPIDETIEEASNNVVDLCGAKTCCESDYSCVVLIAGEAHTKQIEQLLAECGFDQVDHEDGDTTLIFDIRQVHTKIFSEQEDVREYRKNLMTRCMAGLDIKALFDRFAKFESEKNRPVEREEG